jgi:hypothetical protein
VLGAFRLREGASPDKGALCVVLGRARCAAAERSVTASQTPCSPPPCLGAVNTAIERRAYNDHSL